MPKPRGIIMAETINFQRDPQNGPRRYPLLITGALGFALAVTPAYADTNWSTSDESLVITLDDMCSKVAEGALICKEGDTYWGAWNFWLGTARHEPRLTQENMANIASNPTQKEKHISDFAKYVRHDLAALDMKFSDVKGVYLDLRQVGTVWSFVATYEWTNKISHNTFNVALLEVWNKGHIAFIRTVTFYGPNATAYVNAALNSLRWDESGNHSYTFVIPSTN